MRRTRRTVLAGVGVALGTALAGCSGDDGGSDGGGDGDSVPQLSTEPNYRGWFEGVSNYDGTHDYRDRDAVGVRVGVSGNFDFYKYGPAAIAVSPGTEIRWQWTGKGGAHNVEALEGRFDSGDPVQSDSETYTVALDEPAVYKYFCVPHRGQGMRGAVFVALAD